jgi:hypothetical protein
MTKQVQIRRGSTEQHNSFTGAEGEITYDVAKKTIVTHDGDTQGGTPLATDAGAIAYAIALGS